MYHPPDYLASTKNRSSYPDPPQVLHHYLVGVLEDAPVPRPCDLDEEQQIVAHCLDIERSLGLLLVGAGNRMGNNKKYM